MNSAVNTHLFITNRSCEKCQSCQTCLFRKNSSEHKDLGWFDLWKKKGGGCPEVKKFEQVSSDGL